MNTRTLVVLLCAASLAGCEDKSSQPPLAPPKTVPSAAPSTPAAQPSTPAPAAAAAPTAPTPAANPGSAAGAQFSALGMTLALPTGWVAKPPSNQMRLGEIEVPDASADPAKACLVVFSTAGGTVQDNIARWSGQVRDPQGQPVAGTPATRTINGLSVTTIELSGTFAGMGDTAAKNDWTLRGAIFEAPEGLFFVKMTGPASSMKAAAPAFEAMISSATKP